MRTVVCLKWGTKYGPEYVNRLHNMVRRHTTSPVRFVCVTEDSSGLNLAVEVVDLPDLDLEGWWNKLYLFSGEPVQGPCLYLDLDVVIHDNIDILVNLGAEARFVGCRDFLQPTLFFNSSVMRFNPDYHSKVWTSLDRERTLRLRTDQDHITNVLKDDINTTRFPDEWIWSYKWGPDRSKRTKLASPPHHAKICVFHGKPNPDQVNDAWVKEHWQ